jgi:hypothetical protein
MRRRHVVIVAVALAAAAVSGVTITAASAGPSPASSRHGIERFTVTWASLTNDASVIATGLFTDGGTVGGIGSHSLVSALRLGAGGVRLTARLTRHSYTVSPSTCLMTYRASGTYTLGHGTGKYAGIRGSGRSVTTVREVFRRDAEGLCTSHRPLAVQGIATFTGPATLRQ